MLTYPDVCGRMLTFVSICMLCMLTYADICVHAFKNLLHASNCFIRQHTLCIRQHTLPGKKKEICCTHQIAFTCVGHNIANTYTQTPKTRHFDMLRINFQISQDTKVKAVGPTVRTSGSMSPCVEKKEKIRAHPRCGLCTDPHHTHTHTTHTRTYTRARSFRHEKRVPPTD